VLTLSLLSVGSPVGSSSWTADIFFFFFLVLATTTSRSSKWLASFFVATVRSAATFLAL
jgi:hypothetical protein